MLAAKKSSPGRASKVNKDSVAAPNFFRHLHRSISWMGEVKETL
jgi:hypothetical protein